MNKGANTEIVVSSLGSSQLSEYIFSDNANPEIIQLLIEKGANVNATNMEGNTPLHMLALNDDLSRENIKSIAKILIDKGADINAKNSNGFTPMDEAERSKNKTLVSVLAEYGVRSTGAVKAYEANERRKQAEYERKKTCAHLYQGKLVEMEPGGFYIKYEVVGFSPQTGRVTLKCLSNLCLKGKSYGDYEELHCSEVD